MLQIENTIISDCVVLKPNIYQDTRGMFTEIYKKSILSFFQPVQSNCSVSKSGVLRGIHRTPYAKLVTCVSGRIYDVCVDLRPDSPSYNMAFGIELNSNNLLSLYIPPYCGHGFLAIEDSAVIYHQDGEYNSKTDETYCYARFNIEWPFQPQKLSDKDKASCES